jgi:2-polyprenyl-6-hydroxyphenyl methylase/3-demethylubiquinone-9 3-methyltransferase
MVAVCLIPIVLQGAIMVVDEGWFHRARGLPRWERLGHPLDTLTLAACLMWLLAMPHAPDGLPATPIAIPGYIVLAGFSTVFVTKDEGVHARLCSAGEHWLHAMLFVLHPIVLAAFAYLWWLGADGVLVGQLGLTLAFCAYQIIYWNFDSLWRAGEPERADAGAPVKPIALVRAEARARNPWIAGEIERTLGPGAHRVLDLGGAAGFCADFLAARGHAVTAIDALAEPHALPFAAGRFDAVCAMDLLEHVEDPDRLIGEAARVLAPGGMFLFHTFNRTWQADLVMIKGLAWFVRNAPADLHALHLFVTPDEVRDMCVAHHLEAPTLRGSRPHFGWPLWRLLLTGRVGDDFMFTSCASTKLGYTGVARRDAAPACDLARERRLPTTISRPIHV